MREINSQTTNGSQLANMKKYILTCYCHKIQSKQLVYQFPFILKKYDFCEVCEIWGWFEKLQIYLKNYYLYEYVEFGAIL